MQTITITLSVPDGVQVNVSNGAVADTLPPEGQRFLTSSTAVVAPAEPTGPTLKELTAAFLAAAAKCKEKGDLKFLDAMKALGCPTVKGVPAVMYAEVIAALNAITAG